MSSSPADVPAPVPTEDRAAARRRVRHQHAIERRRRYIIGGLAVALAVLLVNAIVGENGYLATLRLRAEEQRLAASVAAVRLENQQLQDDAKRLRHDPAALEEAARGDLGLARPGETLVVIRDVPAPVPGPSR